MTIIQFMPQFGLAGAETMCENLTYELVGMGHKVIVVSLYDYHSPITDRIKQHDIPIIFLGKKIGLDISIIKRIRAVLKQYRPDIIHTHLYTLKYVALASVGLKVKGIVHTVHNIAQKENTLINRMINYVLFKKGKVVPVALSQLVRTTIEKVYHLPQTKIPIIYNGVPLPEEKNKRDYSLADSVKIINIGRYTDVKNQESLINAVAELHKENSHIQLDIYGDGPTKSRLNAAIKKQQAEGFIRDNGLTSNVKEKLRDADIFVLPSLYEGMPMTIIEAMGAAMPIIASRVGGIPDMIEDGVDGLLCEPNKESIKSCLLRITNTPSLCKKLGSKAFKKAEVFSARRMALAYEKLYSSLI